MVSHLFRDNRKHWDINLVGCIYPLPIRSYSLTRDLAKTRYGLLGSLTPEPLFVNDPTPILHLTHERASVYLFFIMSKTPVHHIYIPTPLHSPQNTRSSIFFTLHKTPTVTPFLNSNIYTFHPTQPCPSLITSLLDPFIYVYYGTHRKFI